MKTEESSQAHQARLSEGMRLIFDQETSSSRSTSRSSSPDSSYSSSSGSSYRSDESRRSRRRHRRRSRSSTSDSSSSSDSRSRTRSRSHPRCHRASDRSRCRHRSPPRRYRACSRSFSPSPYRSSRHGRRHRAYSRSSSRSSSRGRYSRCWRRSRSRSSSYRGVTSRFVGRYRCRFSPSPRRRYRDHRSRSRSPEGSAVRLSKREKMDLLNIAKENATKILGVQNLELPSSVMTMEQQTKQQEKKPEPNTEEWVRADPVSLKKPAEVGTAEDDSVPKMSPSRKPITFSINNTVAKPSSSPTFHVAESKVTSRADSVGNRKPYGHWVPIKKSSPNKH
uniref:Arginine/serine-rich protein 1 n=1 Tax=Pygocentrus nattereri TaxID=42514 RepID=A0A3B4CGM7_PYGNA